MAFGSRNSILTLFLCVGAFFVLLFPAGVLVLSLAPGGAAAVPFFQSHPFWFLYDLNASGVIENQIGGAVLLLGGAVAFFLARLAFRKTGQPEIFFFSLFLFSFLAESLRTVVLCLELYHLPPALAAVLSQVVFSGRIFGALSLFFASLYALDFQYQKFEIVMVLSLLIALVLTFSTPFDPKLLLTTGLLKLSDELGIFIIYAGLHLFILVSYCLTLARGRTWLIPAGVFLLLAGREALFFTLSPFVLAGGACALVAGFWLSYRGLEIQYNVM